MTENHGSLRYYYMIFLPLRYFHRRPLFIKSTTIIFLCCGYSRDVFYFWDLDKCVGVRCVIVQCCERNLTGTASWVPLWLSRAKN